MDLMRQRDMQQHTYADYLTWSADWGDAIINGVAYVREPNMADLATPDKERQ